MKSSTLAIVFLVITIAWIASGGKSVSAPFHTDRLEILPSVGQVRDAESAEAIGRSVLVHLLSPERFKGITSYRSKIGGWYLDGHGFVAQIRAYLVYCDPDSAKDGSHY